MNLYPGYKIIYERKGNFTFFSPINEVGFGNKNIPVYGSITDILSNKTDLSNRIIMIQAEQNGKVIYEKFVKTNKTGNFDSFFIPTEDGTIRITAKLTDENSTTAEGVVSVIVVESIVPIFVISVLAGLAITVMAVYLHLEESVRKKPYVAVSYIVIVIGLTIPAFVVLFRFPPFDAAGNAAFATAIIAPTATLIFQILTDRGSKDGAAAVKDGVAKPASGS
jgi:hypothetical protein